jgi:hypothetical protein
MERPLYSVCLAMLFTSGPMNAQTVGDELNINSFHARFSSHGLISLDPATASAGFEVPAGTGGAKALFSGGLWFGGLTTDNQLRMAAMMYEANGAGDYYTGPLTTDGSASTDAAMMQAYNRVWSVSRDAVEQHIAYFTCLADVNCDPAVAFPNGYTIPASINDWPAMNTESGYSTYQAPFFDFNADGNYVPSDGDAPCILGDQALYFVFNDKGGSHLLTGSSPIGLEIQAMPFAYSGNSPALDQTVFVHYHIINRGTQQLLNTRIGVFNDLDLGCPDDDRMGSDPSRNLTYVYNGDGLDEDCVGVLGYGAEPPAFGMVLLKGQTLDPNAADDPAVDLLPAWNGTGFGDSVVDNERSGMDKVMSISRDGPSCCNDPSTLLDFNSYLRGYWKDGSPLTYGGSGYNTGVPTNYASPGASDPLGVGTGSVPQSPWYDVAPNPDRRTVTSLAPLTVEPGQHMDLLFAYVYARANGGGALASVEALQTRVDSVRAFANTLPLWSTFSNEFQGDCEGVHGVGQEELFTSEQLVLFPVPAGDRVQVNVGARLAGERLVMHDATGRIVAQHLLVAGLNDLDIQALARGVYAVEVRSIRAHYTGKLVKE